MKKSFREVLKEGRFIVTSEVGPPKGTNVDRMVQIIELLKDKVDALNVTDNQGSVMRYPSWGGCFLIVEQGGEPILQVTCRDRNRLAIQQDLLFAHSRGIRNVLCLTGDSIDVGDHKEAKPVFDLDSVQLINLVQSLNSGKDIGGNQLDSPTDFCIGACTTASAEPIEPHLIKLQQKIDAGIQFIQTQAVYDLDQFKRFMNYLCKLNKDVKVLAGIVLLTGPRMAVFLNENVPGIFVPQPLIDQLQVAPKGKALSVGIEIAGRTIREIKEEGLCDGVHIMAIEKEEVVPQILEVAGL
ncbi:TPA: 5,10-methylenetetrahydrofolate reductase [bacterium]|nr:5,10-methylenetetrahydrofolate reductase [bacterium]